MLTLTPLPAFDSNYLWLLDDGRDALVVDPGDAQVVLNALAVRGLRLTTILLTHHHPDHIYGVPQLVKTTGATVIGHAQDAHRLPPLDQAVLAGDTVTCTAPACQFLVFATPGHTLGHIVYYGEDLLLCGDTLFSAGCGRMFEGTPAVYHPTLTALAGLPDQVKICPAHEYTVDNLRFALSILPNCPALTAALSHAQTLRANQKATLPSTIGFEKQHNVFLRCADPQIASALGTTNASPEHTFAELRSRKDNFR